MQLNFHNPIPPSTTASHWRGFSDTVGSDFTVELQALTWLGCFWIGNEIANFQGYPPPMSATVTLASVDKAISAVSKVVPEWWHVLMSILRITTTSTNTLSGVIDPDLHSSLTQMFDDQLNELKKKSEFSTLMPEVHIEFWHAKLCLHALTLTLPGSEPGHELHRRTQRETALYRGFEAASALISEAEKLSQLPVPSGCYPAGMLTFVPKHYLTALFSSTTILFRFLITRKFSTSIQGSYAMKSIIAAHKTFQSFHQSRDCTRAAIHIETMVNVLLAQFGNSTMESEELLITNRLAASVMFDALFRAGQCRNQGPVTGAVTPVQEWRSMNEKFAERMPRTPKRKVPEDNSDSDIPGIAGLDFSSQHAMTSPSEVPVWLGD